MNIRTDASTDASVGLMKARPRWIDRLAEVNRELWLILSLFVIAALLNWLVPHPMG